MTLEEYVRRNRTHIDQFIKEDMLASESQLKALNLDDDDREIWVLNVEELYLDAREAGVHEI